MKAVLIYYRKAEFYNRYLMELSVHQISSKDRYPDGVKYGFFFLDKLTGKKLLMDNHYPKGHHVHIDGTEIGLKFESVKKLEIMFKQLVLKHFGVRL